MAVWISALLSVPTCLLPHLPYCPYSIHIHFYFNILSHTFSICIYCSTACMSVCLTCQLTCAPPSLHSSTSSHRQHVQPLTGWRSSRSSACAGTTSTATSTSRWRRCAETSRSQMSRCPAPGGWWRHIASSSQPAPYTSRRFSGWGHSDLAQGGSWLETNSVSWFVVITVGL